MPATSSGTTARDRLDGLRRHVAGIERPAANAPVFKTGVAAIDRALPWRGLPAGTLHEVEGERDDAAALGFVAALAAAAQRQAQGRDVLWCHHGREVRERGALYAPGLVAWGLSPRHVVFVAGNTPNDVLWAMEEALRARAFAAVVGDGVAPGFTPARRLQLAAAGGEAVALTLWPTTAAKALSHSPALTRWRVTARPTTAGDDFPAARGWTVALTHCRGAAPAAWALHWDETKETADAPFSGAVAAPLADGPMAARAGAAR
jgi:protein ImuA